MEFNSNFFKRLKTYRYPVSLFIIAVFFLLYYFSRINLEYIESTGDNYTYELLAETVFTDHPFKINFKIDFYDDLPIYHHERVVPPLFPVVLALLHRLIGDGMFVNLFATSIIGVLCALPVYLMGKMLHSEGAGVLAAAAALLFPTFRDTAILGMSEPLFTFLSLWGLYYLIRYWENGSLKQLVYAAVFTGLAYLTRANGVALIATAVFLLIWQGGFAFSKRVLKNKGRNLFIYLGVVFLVASPWLIRNYLVFGDPFYYVGRFTTGLKPGSLHASLNRPTLGAFFSRASVSQVIQRYSNVLWVRAKSLGRETGVLALLMLYGILAGSYQDKKYSVLWFYLVTNFLVLMFAHALHTRYLVSLFPVVGILGVIALTSLYPFQRPMSLVDYLRKGLFRPVFLLLCLAGMIRLGYQSFHHYQHVSPESQLYPRIGRWFKENTAADTVIMSDPTSSVYYYARRPLIMFPRAVKPPDLSKLMKIYSVEYVVLLYQFQLKCLPMKELTVVKYFPYQFKGEERPAVILRKNNR